MEGIWRLSETRVGIELLGQLKSESEMKCSEMNSWLLWG